MRTFSPCSPSIRKIVCGCAILACLVARHILLLRLLDAGEVRLPVEGD